MQKVPGESRSDSVCIQQHQHQHVTARLRNSDDAREDAVQLAGLGGAVEEKRKRVTSASSKEGENDASAGSRRRERHIHQSQKSIRRERTKAWP